MTVFQGTRVRLIRQLQDFHRQHERPPLLSELKPPNPTRGSLRNAFGSVEEAYRQAGFMPRSRRRYRSWSQQQLIGELLLAKEELGREPRALDFVPSHHRNRQDDAMTEWWKRRRRPHMTSFIAHFGSFNAAMRAAGLPTQERIGGSSFERSVAKRKAARPAPHPVPTPSQPERPRTPILTRRVGQKKP